MGDTIPVKEIGALLDELSGKAPKLITGLMDTLYSAESGKKMGQAVGNFYKELVDGGIPQEDALQMAKDYMISLKEITSNISKTTNSTEE
ncbi:MAG TPA: hypothetical protein DIW17_02030 [Clostridiales bacterium]|nr:hypothetical protein [Clostridia bacterium]HCS72640.1 hypothetical protein [Clostridiales bacterium]